MEYVQVYDDDMHLQAVLENADAIGYELKFNDLWTAQFSLPAADPKNEYCRMHYYVRLPSDGGRDLGLYRIVRMDGGDETGLQGMCTYSLEHVMATLLDDVFFQGTDWSHGLTMTDAIQQTLNQQNLSREGWRRWNLGHCDFSGIITPTFESMTLLEVFRELEKWLVPGSYAWEWDVSSYPWTVNLVHSDASVGCGITYRRNMAGVEKTIDTSGLVTRIYPLGARDSITQLTIRDVNGGLPYLTADTAAAWGVKSAIWADTSITDAGFLKAVAANELEKLKNPTISYRVRAVDLYAMTGESWDSTMPGKLPSTPPRTLVAKGIPLAPRYMVTISAGGTQQDRSIKEKAILFSSCTSRTLSILGYLAISFWILAVPKCRPIK